MTNNNWIPGHSTNKGYPYAQIESKALFLNRPKVYQNDENKIVIDIPEGETITDDPTRRTEFEDYLLFRLFDAMQALKFAEGQLEDILTEDPFIPETFGFELVYKNIDPFAPAVRIYVSKFNDAITLYRKHSSPLAEDYNPAIYVLKTKHPDATFTEVEINIPCHRIAYATFYALGVQVEDTVVVKEDLPVIGKMYPTYTGNSKLREAFLESPGGDSFYRAQLKNYLEQMKCSHAVYFRRGEAPNLKMKTVVLNADNNKEAMTQAKFLIETDPEESFQDVQFSELTVYSKEDESN